MMSYDPQRTILKSTLTNPKPGITSSLIRPLLSIGYRIIKPTQTSFNKGNVLFCVTIGCQITFSPDTVYDFEMISVNEIIDNKKPLAVWALKMISDKEVEHFGVVINEDIKAKGILLNNIFTPSFDDKGVEKQIKIELDEFLNK